MGFLYNEIVQDKTQEFSDKKIIHAKGCDDSLQRNQLRQNVRVL